MEINRLINDGVKHSISRIATVKHQKVSRPEFFDQLHGHLPLRGIEGGMHIIDRYFSQDIKHNPGNHLGKIGAVGGFKIFSQCLAVGQVLLRATDGINSKAIPGEICLLSG